MTKIEMKAAVRKAQLIKIREKNKRRDHWTLMRDCWPPISNLSLRGCELLLVVL